MVRSVFAGVEMLLTPGGLRERISVNKGEGVVKDKYALFVA
jgi:hypothetical protein